MPTLHWRCHYWSREVPTFNPSDAQTHFARTIALGPAACPDGLFAGDTVRVLRGLKVHANTISHARLVALEDSFPRTRDFIGHEAFNTLSHGFFDAGHGRGQSLDRLGGAFPRWLEDCETAPLAAELAGFEWLWLESYHAGEAAPFTVLQMVEWSEAELGSLRLHAHPAARCARCSAALAEILGLPGDGNRVLLARPEAEVLTYRIGASSAALFAALLSSESLFAALETFRDAQTDREPLAAMEFLLSAGVLTRRDD